MSLRGPIAVQGRSCRRLRTTALLLLLRPKEPCWMPKPKQVDRIATKWILVCVLFQAIRVVFSFAPHSPPSWSIGVQRVFASSTTCCSYERRRCSVEDPRLDRCVSVHLKCGGKEIVRAGRGCTCFVKIVELDNSMVDVLGRTCLHRWHHTSFVVCG